MTLIKSISGIRGTIGGPCGDALTPVDIVKFVYAYCSVMRSQDGFRTVCRKDTSSAGRVTRRYKVVVGRDARLSGAMVENLVVGTLTACGVDVIKIGLASTPTTEMAVTGLKADGGIILTASHNPRQWNALKLLDRNGEFLTAEQGAAVLACAEKGDFDFADVDSLGKVKEVDYIQKHIDAVLALDLVDRAAIRKAGFKVAVDAVNSVGGVIMPRLLRALGVKVVKVNCNPTGNFAHNPEPLPANLTELCGTVVSSGADLGVSVDPDVDRLALICEDGQPFGEEYTLVSVADYVLSATKWTSKCPYRMATSSNLSSSRALRDVTEKMGGEYRGAAVGEVNVVTKMKEIGAVIGGEGNGGVIYPALHYGRDAMVGVALFLSNLAHKRMTVSQLKATYPEYHIAKNKIQLSDKSLIDKILNSLKEAYSAQDVNTVDGVKISFEAERKWVHLRRSNTEPIIRIYAEAPTMEEAAALGEEVVAFANKIIRA